MSALGPRAGVLTALGQPNQAVAGGSDPLAPWVRRASAPSVVGIVRVVLGRGVADSDDVAQEALLAIHDAIPRFRGDSSFASYARRIALRTALGSRRRRRPAAAEQLSEELVASEPAHEDRVARGRRLQALRVLLDELPEGQAESLAMRVVLGHSLSEVAEATGAAVNTVRSRIRLAREHIRARIGSDPRLCALFERGGTE
jgi:RNA polymerase sigma-70 factor (ECF subfamily)